MCLGDGKEYIQLEALNEYVFPKLTFLFYLQMCFRMISINHQNTLEISLFSDESRTIISKQGANLSNSSGNKYNIITLCFHTETALEINTI